MAKDAAQQIVPEDELDELSASPMFYRRYLEFCALIDLKGTRRFIHQNLEDVGLVRVDYNGLKKMAGADKYWQEIPELAAASPSLLWELDTEAFSGAVGAADLVFTFQPSGQSSTNQLVAF